MYFIFKVFFIFLFMHALLGSAGCCVFWGSNRGKGGRQYGPQIISHFKKISSNNISE